MSSLSAELLAILCCPESKVGLRLLSGSEITRLNQSIQNGAVTNHKGDAVTEIFTEGLITEDSQKIYRINEGIPVLLIDEGLSGSYL